MEAPPTPPVALGLLLADHELGLRQLAGPAGGEVHGVHASEMADPSPYLLGGELLLTAGAGLAGAEPRGAPDSGPDGGPHEGLTDGPGGGVTDAGPYVARLVRAGAAAVGFGVTPVHATVPPSLVDACDRYGLPLLEVPPGTPFTAVGRSVWRLMARARTAELRRVNEAQQSLAAAAARPDPVAAVLRRLAATLGGWAGLLPTGPAPDTGTSAATAGPPPGTAAPTGPAVCAGPPPPPEALAALAALARRVAPGAAATATAAHGGLLLAAHALGAGRALALATPSRAPGDHTVASVAAVLLTLLTADRPAGGTQAAALTRLLLDGEPGEALDPGPWYAVHARGGGDPPALAAALGTVLLDPRGPVVRLLTDREPGAQPGWRLGVSAATGPEGLAGADAQAARALERAESARAPLARHTDPGIVGLVGEAEARAHAEALLGPLSPALRDTLRGWLAHHGSWDRAAAALGVHRNTVRQRVARAAELLGADLDDPDVRMDLWFALRRTARARQDPKGTA
ncbi:PucR family transcriptional regulator [Streptomyces sp. NPDC006544]|uniref:PucR family transcriptional regulator n=1 Tax=Streptomyces sp. NPDC006544 TaxID=3154583 RepID=UPI0033A21932